MSLLIKICGITGADALAAAVDAGADAVGFVFARSPREISPAAAAALASRLPDHVLRVAVFRAVDPVLLASVAEHLRVDRVQADAASLTAAVLPPGARAWPVLREGVDDFSADLPEQLVYEGAASGAGQTVDWDAAAALAQRSWMILAGGLNPDNVGAAVRKVAPAGVDVSSGVEVSRGLKDPVKIAAFVAAARRADEARIRSL